MNVLLWIFQILLALHTVMGAVWKFTNSEQSVPSLSVLPHGVWLGLSVVELLCAAALVLPAIKKVPGILAPVAALCIAAEMILFCVVEAVSAEVSSQAIYWLVVAAVCAFIAVGRLVLRPLGAKPAAV